MLPKINQLKLMAFVAGCLAYGLAFVGSAHGDITLGKLFSDHMVLQQNPNVKIWGTATAGEKLIVKFNGQTIAATAGADGKWSASVKTPAAGGPYEIEVAAKSGTPKLLISDVMIGEVWICAGAINMQSPTSSALNPETEIEQSRSFNKIRFFQVDQSASPKPLDKLGKVTPWSVCSPETVKDFSAIGYFYGRELNKRVKVPIGLIQATYPGTPCEAWADRQTLDQNPKLAPMLRNWDENDDPTSPIRPSNLFNGMLSPLKGFCFRGVVLYQGEANVGRGEQYVELLPALIKSWRTELGPHAVSGDFPFYFVQLTPHRYEGPTEALPEIWEAQQKTLNSIKNVGMAGTTDLGDETEKVPKNKQEVARRLSLWPLTTIYKEKVAEVDQVKTNCGPVYEAMAILDNKIRLTFKPDCGELLARDDEKLSCFSICGEDKKFYPADAWVDGQAVIVTSDKVAKPVAVRFGWKDTAKPNFFNKDGLPALPFRTDKFDLLSKDRHF